MLDEHNQSAITESFINAANELSYSASRYRDYSTLLRPKLFIDGDQWCALYGENIQEGVAGFGETPAKALADFDFKILTSKASNDDVAIKGA